MAMPTPAFALMCLALLPSTSALHASSFLTPSRRAASLHRIAPLIAAVDDNWSAQTAAPDNAAPDDECVTVTSDRFDKVDMTCVEPEQPPAPEKEVVSVVEGLRRTLDSEFGVQVGIATLLFVGFLGVSNSLLTSDWWLSPIGE